MNATPSEMTAIGQFSIQFTLFIAMWNQCEATAKRILQLMLDESRTAMALAVETQNRSLANAILAGASDPKFDKIRTHLDHLVTGYDRLLGYRNYYAHSLLGIDPGGGLLLAVSGKGALKIDRSRVTMSQLESVKLHAMNWVSYAAAIEQELGAKGDGLDALMQAYQSSLQRPTWPDAVKKSPVLLPER